MAMTKFDIEMDIDIGDDIDMEMIQIDNDRYRDGGPPLAEKKGLELAVVRYIRYRYNNDDDIRLRLWTCRDCKHCL